MSRAHNKRRNVGILYELLLRSASDALVVGDKDRAQAALDIIGRHYVPGTKIHQEHRLFNALARATVSGTPVAAAILTEARAAARRVDPAALDAAQTRLLSDIHENLADPMLLHRRIPEYRVYATLQTLLHDWRLGDRADLARVVQYEQRIVEHLVATKDVPAMPVVDKDVDGLVIKIMTEKFNAKYGDRLNELQRDIMRGYITSVAQSDGAPLRTLLESTQTSLLQQLDALETATSDATLLEKLPAVRDRLRGLLSAQLDETTLPHFLTAAGLLTELQDGR